MSQFRGKLKSRLKRVRVTNTVSEFIPKKQLIALLSRLKETPIENRKDWAKWPLDAAFDDATEFVNSCVEHALRTPDIGIADDGEVNFLWKHEDIHLDLGFYGDRTFSYYARDTEGKEITADEVPVREGMHAELMSFVQN